MTENINKIYLPMIASIEDICRIKGIGYVMCGTVIQGTLKHNDKVIFVDKDIKQCIDFGFSLEPRHAGHDPKFLSIVRNISDINLIKSGTFFCKLLFI